MSYYLHEGLTTGNNTGIDQANAFKTLEDAYAGTPEKETLLAFAPNGKLITSALGIFANTNIIAIGVDSNFASDSPFVINGQNIAANIISLNNSTIRYYLKNFTFKNATGDGLFGSSTNGLGFLQLDNCIIELCGGYGINGTTYAASQSYNISLLHKVIIRNCGNYAVRGLVGGVIRNSMLYNNAGGVLIDKIGMLIDNTVIANCTGSTHGILTSSGAGLVNVRNSVIDKNGATGILVNSAHGVSIDNTKITRNIGHGIYLANFASRVSYKNCLIANNASNITYAGSNPLLFDYGGNYVGTYDNGYVDADNLDYRPTPMSIDRRKEETPYLAPTKFYISVGIQGADKIYPNFSITPNIGSVDGGTTVTLNFPDGGANLLTGVTFGGVAGTELSIASDTSATIVTPAHSAAQVDTVASFTGYSNTTNEGSFTYQDSSIFIAHRTILSGGQL